MKDGWDDQKEDLLYSWTNQIAINRKAHYEAVIRCRRWYYVLKVPHIFLISLNLALTIVDTETVGRSFRVFLLVTSIIVAILLFFLDSIMTLLGWSEASIQHAGTVRELDSLKFEMQRELYTPIDERRHWEPLMVFVTEKINQINSTKTNKLLSKDFDDSMVDILSMQWRGIGDNKSPRKTKKLFDDMDTELQDIIEQGKIYETMKENKKEKNKSLWKRVIDAVKGNKDTSDPGIEMTENMSEEEDRESMTMEEEDEIV